MNILEQLRVDELGAELATMGLAHWTDALSPICEARISAHGDAAKWQRAIDELPRVAEDPARLAECLLELSPWRKGPFEIGGVRIDSEWRSDLKWTRLAGAIAALDGRRVLDVGCGNGFYALEMRKAGAGLVLGIDPTPLYVMQFVAVNSFVDDAGTYVLPLRLEELPVDANAFDTAFSMGVLYHQRSPIEHLRTLRAMLRPGGQLVLETLFIPGEESYACTPPERYARMRNVWLLPTIVELTTWLQRTGYRSVEIVDRSVTTTEEQRTTEWMTFESLAEALDPADASRTVEGWPAPRRVVVTATSP